MEYEATITVEPTPKEMAVLLWNMYSTDQAEMLNHLYEIAGGEYDLMMQFLAVRRDCESRNDNSLAAFQALFSCAFTHAQIA